MADRIRRAGAHRIGPRLLTVHLPALVAGLAVATPVAAQGPPPVGGAGEAAAPGDTVKAIIDTMPQRPKKGAQFAIPLASISLPGLGQYLHGAWGTGVAYTGSAGGALGLALWVGADPAASDPWPRRGRDQFAYEAAHAYQSIAFLSAWDAFHQAIPGLQTEGKYEFLPPRESLGDLLTAPFEPEFLRRPTTWAHLAYTGLVAVLAVGGREPGIDYQPFRLNDAAFATSLSYNAAVSEEALFRGWIFPLLHQNLGQRFWLSNSLQAGTFGLLHLGQAGPYALMITGWAWYEGWVTRRNNWSIRESIFHHFWYDVVISVAEMLVEERRPVIRISLPTIRF
jgi:membrane protease YdiL (CAAX protease family)